MRLKRILLVLLATAAASAGGCSAWKPSDWDMSQYRDPRAADIERRLTTRPPAVEESFGAESEEDESP